MAYSPQHLDRLRLRHLRLLELIDRHQSLRAVGAVLNLTQPAVSQMLKDLEHALGARLVERSARGATLTGAGQLALQRARSGLAALDHLAEELQADLLPTVRVGTNPAVTYQLLPEALRRLDAPNANLRFKVVSGTVNDMLGVLVSGELDCYVGRVDWDKLTRATLDVLHYDPLNATELVLACSASHALAGRNDLTARDLLEWSWALPPSDSNIRVAVETAFRDCGLSGPEPVVELAADPNAFILLAREVPFLVCVPRRSLETHVAAGALSTLDLPDLRFPTFQVGFVTLAQNRDAAPLQILRQALLDAVR